MTKPNTIWEVLAGNYVLLPEESLKAHAEIIEMMLEMLPKKKECLHHKKIMGGCRQCWRAVYYNQAIEEMKKRIEELKKQPRVRK